jgi:hypothetical protein
VLNEPGTPWVENMRKLSKTLIIPLKVITDLFGNSVGPKDGSQVGWAKDLRVWSGKGPIRGPSRREML